MKLAISSGIHTQNVLLLTFTVSQDIASTDLMLC